MKKLLGTVACLLFSVSLFSSCSGSDDEPGDGGGGSLIVNGESCRIHSATCSFHGTIVDNLGEFEIPPHGGFNIQLEYDGSLYYFEFSVDGLSSQDRIQIGQNLVDDGLVEVHGFHRLTSAELSTRYSGEDGRLAIKKKGDSYVVVDFSNFSFVKDTGKSETTYTMKGEVKFSDINAD